MSYSRLFPAALTVTALIAGSASAEAGQARRGGVVVASRSVAVARPAIVPGAVRAVPYRPYYYPYFRPGFSVGFYAGYPFGYYPYAYPYGYAYGYYNPYAYPAPGYVAAVPGGAYGSVRIEGAPRDAQVFADNYYVGVASDFDGPVQHLNLPPGSHHVEVRAAGAPPVAVDVNVEAGHTIDFHANVR